MKRKLFLVLAFAILSSFIASGYRVADEKGFEEEVAHYRDSVGNMGLSIAVVRDNRLEYVKSFGFADAASSVLVTENTIFRIASVSKTFTATAMMQLVESGKADLDQDVSQIVGFDVRNPSFPDSVITVAMLLSHKSSINDSQGYDNLDVINPSVSETWKLCYSDSAPGVKYQYSNLNYSLLGACIEIISGERFDRYVSRHICRPLGIEGSFDRSSVDQSNISKLYSLRKGKLVERKDSAPLMSERNEEYRVGYDAPVLVPAGGMMITVPDLAKYMVMHMNYGKLPRSFRRVLSEKTSLEMQKPYKGGFYGLGLCVKRMPSLGINMIGHNGGAYGLNSGMYFNPEEKYGMVIISNGAVKSDNIIDDIIGMIYRHFIAD